MIQVLLSTTDDVFAEHLTEAIGPNFRRISLSEIPTDLPGLLRADGVRPHIVLLDCQGQEDAALDLAGKLQEQGVATILISPLAAELALPALRAGVRDLLAPEASADDIRGALDRTAVRLAPTAVPVGTAPVPVEAVEGRVIAVISPKGGVGKTTVASNLAVGLSARHPQSTVLVDLDVHFGDVASALNLEPQHTLPDIARGPASHDSIAVKSYLTPHQTGLFVIPGSDSPAAADAVTPADVSRLLRLLRSQFQFVVVDTAPGLSEHTLAVLDEANTLVMVTSLDVPGIRGLRKEIDTLSELRLLSGARYVVLNFADPSRGLSIADVEATIRAKVDVVIPQSNAVPLSVNQGIPLLQSAGRDVATQRFGTLVDLISPVDSAAPRRGLFGRRSRP